MIVHTDGDPRRVLGQTFIRVGWLEALAAVEQAQDDVKIKALAEIVAFLEKNVSKDESDDSDGGALPTENSLAHPLVAEGEQIMSLSSQTVKDGSDQDEKIYRRAGGVALCKDFH